MDDVTCDVMEQCACMPLCCLQIFSRKNSIFSCTALWCSCIVLPLRGNLQSFCLLKYLSFLLNSTYFTLLFTRNIFQQVEAGDSMEPKNSPDIASNSNAAKHSFTSAGQDAKVYLVCISSV